MFFCVVRFFVFSLFNSTVLFFSNVLHWFLYIFSFKVSHCDCLLFRFISDTDRSMLFCYIDVFFQ